MGGALSSVAGALGDALPAGWRLREETDADLPFLGALYASTRKDELAPVPWSAEQKSAFLSQQFNLQRQHYRSHCADAGFWLIECGRQPRGRIYVHSSAAELRLMDIALIVDQRGRGIGSGLIRALQATAKASGKFIGLHVEPNNPALRLYRRLGFAEIEERGVYRYLRWPAVLDEAVS